jgi:hypothetical protein
MYYFFHSSMWGYQLISYICRCHVTDEYMNLCSSVIDSSVDLSINRRIYDKFISLIYKFIKNKIFIVSCSEPYIRYVTRLSRGIQHVQRKLNSDINGFQDKEKENVRRCEIVRTSNLLSPSKTVTRKQGKRKTIGMRVLVSSKEKIVYSSSNMHAIMWTWQCTCCCNESITKENKCWNPKRNCSNFWRTLTGVWGNTVKVKMPVKKRRLKCQMVQRIGSKGRIFSSFLAY